MANKKQLLEEAKEIGVKDYSEEDTNKVLEAKIAERKIELEKGADKQEEKNASNQSGGSIDDEGNDSQVPTTGVVTTSSFVPGLGDTSEPVVEEDANDDDEKGDETDKNASNASGGTWESPDSEEQVKAEEVQPAAEPQTPEEDEGQLVKYVGESSSYQIKAHRFTKNSPFAVLDTDFWNSIKDDSVDLEPSTKEEATEFFKDNE